MAATAAGIPNQGVPLVFIHGIKGARLAGPDGAHWVTALQAMGLSSPRLALPLVWPDGGAQAGDDLRPAGVLDRVRVIPWVLEEKIYGPWLAAAGSFGRPFLPFAYDWRRDNHETADRLEAFLKKVRDEHGGAKVQVVAHSMGGLITLVVLNRHPELFHSVVFAGVPFQGGIGFLPDLHAGTSIGLNRRILAPEVLATFPSVYTLFPGPSEALVRNGEVDLTDFFSPAEWKRQELGAYAPGRALPDGWDAYFAKALERAAAFRAGLPARPGIAYPPILVVVSRSHPSLARGAKDGPKARLGWDFDSELREPGDGRVLERHARPPAGIPHTVYTTKREHADMLNDPAIIDVIRVFP